MFDSFIRPCKRRGMVTVNVLIDEALNASLLKEARSRGLSKSDVIRERLRTLVPDPIRRNTRKSTKGTK